MRLRIVRLKRLHRLRVADVEAVHRHRQLVGEQQQRRLLEVRDQEQQEVLVPELAEHAAFPGREKNAIVVLADHASVRPVTDSACRRSARAGAAPEAVVAVVALRSPRATARSTRSVVGRARPRDEAEADEVGARERDGDRRARGRP